MMGHRSARLSAVALGVSIGVVCALTMMIFAWSAWLGGYATQMIEQWATVFPGIEASLKGGFIAGAWGFVEGFIFGVVTGWIYNLCLCCCSRKCCCGKCCSGSSSSDTCSN